jgi:hypothetical protein
MAVPNHIEKDQLATAPEQQRNKRAAIACMKTAISSPYQSIAFVTVYPVRPI